MTINSSSIKCVIFDSDGTLVDSEYLCNLAIEIQLKEYGINLAAKKIMKEHLGGQLTVTLDKIMTEYQIELKEDFISSYRSIVADLFKEKLQPCEGVPEMLAELDLPKCVASNGPMEKIEQALQVTGLTDFFDTKLYSAFEINSWKPAPELFFHAAKEMGFHPNECAVVEDSAVGLAAAKAAGMFTVLYDPHAMHQSTEGAHKIYHMNQLKKVILDH